MKLPAVFIDCILVILIAQFGLNLLLKPVSEELTLPAIQLPQSAQSQAGLTQNEALKVTSKGEGDHVSIFADDKAVDEKGLGEVVTHRQNKEVVIRADKGVNWGTGIRLMGYLNSLGINGISIAYEPAGG